MMQESGIDDDVVVMTEDYDDLMDEDAVVLPDANYASVSCVAACLQPQSAASTLPEGIRKPADAACAVCIPCVSMHCVFK